MEVLATLQHAQLRIGHDFTHEEFIKGKIGGYILPEDFKPEETVSSLTHIPIPTLQALLRLRYLNPL